MHAEGSSELQALPARSRSNLTRAAVFGISSWANSFMEPEMADLDLLKDAVDQSTKLWMSGQHREALELLDKWIARAKSEDRDIWVKVLSMHACLISDSINDLGRTKQYCEDVLAREPDNPLALSALADVLFRQGETDLAKRYAVKSYALVANSSTQEGRGLFELLTKKWPGIDEW
jgi:hypothetical protein